MVPRAASCWPGATAEDMRGRLEPEMFRWRPGDQDGVAIRPSRRRALDALPEGSTVLSVGVGGGRSGLPLGVRASRIVGVERSGGMLASFEASARDAGIDARGPPSPPRSSRPTWSCATTRSTARRRSSRSSTRSTGHARRRVVVEVSTLPPPWGLALVWKAVHGTDRPVRPVADPPPRRPGTARGRPSRFMDELCARCWRTTRM